MNILYVGLGGFLGGLCRVAIAEWLPYEDGFPIATFIVNCLGSVLFAFFLASSIRQNNKIKLFCTTGFFGSFTTFSAFSYESVTLIEDGQYGILLSYVGSSLIISLMAVLFVMNGSKRRQNE